MKKYIEAESFKEDLIKRGFYPVIIKKALEDAPEAAVKPIVHAHWIKQYHEYDFGPPFEYSDYKCSHCNSREENARNYCPECGAKMDEKESKN